VIYLFAGLLASAAMLLYRRPPGRTSPLWAVELDSSALAERLHGRGDKVVSFIGIAASFSVLFLISALRHGIGTDYWARYAPLFEQIRRGRVDGHEIGFVILNDAAALITTDYQGIFALTSLLTIALFFRFFLRMSVNPALSVLIYAFGGFYLEAFNLVQQGLAIAILVNTIELALRNKNLSFVLVTLLATSIHTSAFVWFAVWPLMWVRVGRAKRIFIALAMMGIILLVPQTVSLLVSQLAPSYSWYFESNYGTTRGIQPVVVIVAIAAFVFAQMMIGRTRLADHARTFTDAPASLLHGRKGSRPAINSGRALMGSGRSATLVRAGKPLKDGHPDRYADVVVNLLAVSTAVLLATLTIAYLFSRLNYYFAPAQMLAVPLALSLVRGKLARQLLTLGFMCAYMTSFIFQFIVWNAHGVLPYDSIFSR
jgi:hypothetical protein